MRKLETYSELIRPLFDIVDVYTTVESLNVSIQNVPRPLLLLHAANFCLSEVHDSGLLQYFFNSTGSLCPEAISGFHALGMPALAETLAIAAAPLGTPYPRDREDRLNKLLEAPERSEREIEEIAKTSSNFYLFVERVTQPLRFAALDEKIWQLANGENGGFQHNAMRYAQEFADQREQSMNVN